MAEIVELDGRDMTTQRRHEHAAAFFIDLEAMEGTDAEDDEFEEDEDAGTPVRSSTAAVY
jgi:hypothetical protein